MFFHEIRLALPKLAWYFPLFKSVTHAVFNYLSLHVWYVEKAYFLRFKMCVIARK